MIIVGLRGGLGNQLFQYAFGRRLSIQHQCELYLDTSEYQHHLLRSFQLGQFHISARIAPVELLRSTRQWYSRLPFGRYRYGLRLVWDSLARRFLYVEEDRLSYDEKLVAGRGPAYLWGYWQDERYFAELETLLREEFTLRGSLEAGWAELASEIAETDSVCMHVRRGDYATRPDLVRDFGLCDELYYTRAIETLQERLVAPRVFLFSDDPSWCVKHFGSSRQRIVIVPPSRTPNGIDHFQLMRDCKHHIIANSSFSWWSAWLSDSPQKQVVAPTPWFSGKHYHDFDPVPKGWIRVTR